MSLPETPLLQLSPARLPSHKIHHYLKEVWDWNHFQTFLPDRSCTSPSPLSLPQTGVPTLRTKWKWGASKCCHMIEELRAEKKYTARVVYTKQKHTYIHKCIMPEAELEESTHSDNDELQQMPLTETPLLQLSPARLRSHKINHSLKKVWDWNHFQTSFPDRSCKGSPPLSLPQPACRARDPSGIGRLLNVIT